MHVRFWAVAAVSLLVGGGAEAETTTHYACGGGPSFEAVFSADGSRLALAFAGQEPVALRRAISGASFRYLGGGYELQGRKDAVVLVRPGAAPVRCRVAEGDAGTAAKPSFPCDGDLGAAERQICGSATLAGLDRRLAEAYGDASTRLSGAAQQALVQGQRRWLAARNRCKADAACLEARYRERLAALGKAPGQGGASGGAIGYPRPARSWGGVVRSGPGLTHKRIGSLRESAAITLLGDTGVEMNGYNWFKIRFRRRVGYHWGGLICPKGGAIPGTFKVCD